MSETNPVAEASEDLRQPNAGYSSVFDTEAPVPKSPDVPKLPDLTAEPQQGPHPQGQTGSDNDQKLTDVAEQYGLTQDEIKQLLTGGKDGKGGGGGKSKPMSYAEKAEAANRSALTSVYMELWGEMPPQAVIDDAIGRGLNRYQFEDEQRNDPSFAKTETYQNEYASKAMAMARLLGWRA